MLSGGELKYFKNEKEAHLSNSQPLKSIPLSEVLCATVNPRHADMFVVDLGGDKKVKLQATSEHDRCVVCRVRAACTCSPLTCVSLNLLEDTQRELILANHARSSKKYWIIESPRWHGTPPPLYG